VLPNNVSVRFNSKGRWGLFAITVFDLFHNIRVIMGKRDVEYSLENMVEHVEDFITKATDVQQRSDISRGRGKKQKAIVAVMVE
jgi:hypothetical protein